MIEFLKAWVELKPDKRAVTALEYALVADVMVAGVTTLGSNPNNKFTAVANSL